MDKKHQHLPARPSFLCQSPGLLDMLYNMWTAAFNASAREKPSSTKINTPPAILIPPHIHYIADDVVIINKDKYRIIINPFCEYTNISTENLVLACTWENTVALNRKEFDFLLKLASQIFIDQNADWMVRGHAQALMQDFECLKGQTQKYSQKPQISPSTKPSYKTPSP